MAIALPDRPREIERAVGPLEPPARHRPQRVTPFRLLLGVVTLHLAVSAVFADSSWVGNVVAAGLLVAAAVGTALLYDSGRRFRQVALCAGAGTLGVAHTVGVALNRVTRTGFGADDALFAPALLAS